MKLLDSHVDTLFQISKSINPNCKIHYRPDLDVDIKKLILGKVGACFFVLYKPHTEDSDEKRIYNIIQQYNIFCDIISNNNILNFSKSPDDIITAIYNDKISISLGLENGISVSSITLLRFYYNMGIRYITLCHNQSNQICDSSTDIPKHGGLSEFGYSVVKEMNRLGIMVDISHASDESVEDILNISTKPIIASHSCTYSLFKNARNLNDRLLKRIAKNNGVIQVTLLPKCVGRPYDLPSFINHIDYIRDLIGIDHIGIGSDFDGGGGIEGCRDASQAYNIVIELQKRKYTEKEIEKIWGLNFLRVFACCS